MRTLSLALAMGLTVSSLAWGQTDMPIRPSTDQWLKSNSAYPNSETSLPFGPPSGTNPSNGGTPAANALPDFSPYWVEPTRKPLQRHKDGVFQSLRFSGGWLDSGGRNQLGMSHLDTSLTFAVPLGGFDNVIMVTPGFRVDYLEGPTFLDVPSQVYKTGIDFLWRRAFNDRWSGIVGIAPQIYSDFEASDEALRITGRAFATWQWIPDQLQLTFGIVYLDRDDISLLPAAGLIWTPTPDWKFDLLFPKPRIAYRYAFSGSRSEDWVYLTGALGGQTWAVRRASGANDQLTVRDYRLLLGVEHVVDGGGGRFIEIGYVFGRSLEYASSPAEFNFNDGVFLRAGISF